MDAVQFDTLTRRLATSRTRRGALRLLAGTLGWSFVAPLRPEEAAAKCVGLNQSCKKPKKGRSLGKRRRCCSGTRCDQGLCRADQCVFGLTLCAGRCIEVLSDPNNCGACANRCPDGRSCCNGTCSTLQESPNCGACGTVCPAGTSCCGGTCVNLQDPANCGSCGNACRPGQFCQGGACVDRCTDDGQVCQTDAQCCRFPESVCLNLGVTRVCGRNCVGAASQCLNIAPGPFCCSGLTCVGGRCTQDQQPSCRLYGTNCGPGQPPCCDGVPCNGGLCRFN